MQAGLPSSIVDDVQVDEHGQHIADVISAVESEVEQGEKADDNPADVMVE